MSAKVAVAVAFGEEVHIYPLDDDRAVILHTVAIGANLDAELLPVSERDVELIKAHPALAFIDITDHRTE